MFLILFYLMPMLVVLTASIRESKRDFFRRYENRNATRFTVRDFVKDDVSFIYLFGSFFPLLNIAAAIFVIAWKTWDRFAKSKVFERIANIKL